MLHDRVVCVLVHRGRPMEEHGVSVEYVQHSPECVRCVSEMPKLHRTLCKNCKECLKVYEVHHDMWRFVCEELDWAGCLSTSVRPFIDHIVCYLPCQLLPRQSESCSDGSYRCIG